jgi:hypothetical protein
MYVSNPDINTGYPLQEIAVPVLIVNAVDDPLALYANAQAAAERIPGAKLVTIDDGGHMILGHEERIRPEIAAFLDECASTGTTKDECPVLLPWAYFSAISIAARVHSCSRSGWPLKVCSSRSTIWVGSLATAGSPVAVCSLPPGRGGSSPLTFQQLRTATKSGILEPATVKLVHIVPKKEANDG